MLIIVGYGLVINRHYLKDPFKYILVRFVVLFIIGYMIKFLILDQIMHDVYFDIAFFTILMLPPNIGLLLVASEYCEKEKYELANSITAFALYCLLYCLLSTQSL